MTRADALRRHVFLYQKFCTVMNILKPNYLIAKKS